MTVLIIKSWLTMPEALPRFAHGAPQSASRHLGDSGASHIRSPTSSLWARRATVRGLWDWNVAIAQSCLPVGERSARRSSRTAVEPNHHVAHRGIDMPPRARIDVHAHFVPPAWRAACEAHGHSRPDGMPGIPVCLALCFPQATGSCLGT